MRQALGPKKVKRIRELTGLDVKHVAVRGGTDHRKDLYLADGTITHLWPDGTLEAALWSDGKPVTWESSTDSATDTPR